MLDLLVVNRGLRRDLTRSRNRAPLPCKDVALVDARHWAHTVQPCSHSTGTRTHARQGKGPHHWLTIDYEHAAFSGYQPQSSGLAETAAVTLI